MTKFSPGILHNKPEAATGSHRQLGSRRQPGAFNSIVV